MQQGDSEEIDLESLARDEFLRLQRQYRLMEGDKKPNEADGTGARVNKKERTVQYLEKTRETLLVDLKNAVAPHWLAQDKESINAILEMIDRYLEHNLEIEYQLEQIAEMDEQVDKITQRVVAQKLKIQSIFGNSITLNQAERRRKVLENRLYHITTLHNTKVIQNRAIRDEVTLSLHDRGKFHERYLALKQRIQRLRKKMGEIVDIAASTYDQREEATAKIRILRERNDKESKQHVLEMKEAQRILHHDQKGRNFRLLKIKPRSVIEADEDRKKRLDLAKEKVIDDLLNSYKVSFRDILALANTGDIDTLARNYLSQEHTNFVKFRYINDLNEETKYVLQDVVQLKKDIEEALITQRKIKHERMKAMLELDAKFNAGQHRLKKCTTQLKRTETEIEIIMQHLSSLFKIAKCDDSLIEHLLGNTEGLNFKPRNALMALGILERCISDIQYEKSILEGRRSIDIDGNILQGRNQGTPTSSKNSKQIGGPYKPKIMVSMRLEEENDDDEDEETLPTGPLPYEEIKAAIIEKMTKPKSSTSAKSSAVSTNVPSKQSKVVSRQTPSQKSA